MAAERGIERQDEAAGWRRCVMAFLGVFFGAAALIYLIILLVDPYGNVAFSLPLERRIVSISQRHVYPQIVHSGRYDSLIVGSSTARLLDPHLLDGQFGTRFANLSMNSMQAWEQKTMIDLFLRKVGPPKVLIVGLDSVWCVTGTGHDHGLFGFPEWLYDDDPWNDYLYLLNSATAEIAGRQIGNWLGLSRERIRADGFEVFTPPEDRYDLAKARKNIWLSREPQPVPDLAPPPLSADERGALAFQALPWLDEMLRRMPSSLKILAHMPVHVAAQPWPGTKGAAIEAECKARIAEIGRRHGAKVIDWRIASPITREDSNYWDLLHYRVPIATRMAEQMGDAALRGKPSEDYRLVVP